MGLIYHPDAEIELIKAAQFYEQRVATLGSQFLDATDIAVGTIQDDPERWPVIELDVRRYLIPRFPYAIYYRVLPDQVRNLAIKHNSRHPDYWRYRLANHPLGL
jgi:toxin ParE1/3/4